MFKEDFLSDPEEQFVADMQGWLHARAFKYCRRTDHIRFEDVVQEGRIQLWTVYRESQDTEKAMSHASMRMKEVAYGVSVRMTGEAPRARYTAPQQHTSLDRKVSEEGDITLGDLLAGKDYLEDVELSYHYGEIQKAFDALTPKQKKYVYARFWCGIDMPAGSRNDGIKQAKEQNPILTRDVLWTGNKTSQGAKKILAEKLAHLHDLIRT